jgi:hypothetical protein
MMRHDVRTKALVDTQAITQQQVDLALVQEAITVAIQDNMKLI